MPVKVKSLKKCITAEYAPASKARAMYFRSAQAQAYIKCKQAKAFLACGKRGLNKICAYFDKMCDFC